MRILGGQADEIVKLRDLPEFLVCFIRSPIKPVDAFVKLAFYRHLAKRSPSSSMRESMRQFGKYQLFNSSSDWTWKAHALVLSGAESTTIM
jgi:hypothetical protein